MKTTNGLLFNKLNKATLKNNSFLEITTLGGLSMCLDGKPVPSLHSRKAQALLVYLAVTARPQSREVLADLLWEEFPQKSAMNNLRVVLSNLRKHLVDYLLVTRDTVAINPEVDYELDVAVVDANLESVGEYKKKTGMLNGESVALIEQAVGLYKGEFLEGFFVENAPEFDAWMVVERERLHHSLLDGLGKLVRWELKKREYTTGIRYASKWLQLDPLSETAHQVMMQMLAFSGQRSAALAQYEKCRDILKIELGLSPGARTTALFEQIREGELAPDETRSLRISPAETVQPDVHRHNLPVQTTRFIGRERELEELHRLMRDPEVRLVTIMGAGGMGKTRLALEAGEGILDQFTDGVFFVSLARLGSEELIVPSVIQALEIEFAWGERGGGDSPTDLKETLLRYLRRKQLLLILDNFEHLLYGVNLVSEILQTALDVKILATSRTRLNLDGEYRIQVGGMKYPEDIKDGDAQKYSAVRLFLETARRVRSGYKPSPDEMMPIVKICRLVDGMPLGIRLAASWVEALSPEEIAVEIAKSIDLLETDLRDVPERHRSIRALYDHSWNLLFDRERAVFQGFSVFRGGCTREAAQEITGATLRDLRNLADKSLLNRSLNGRYEIHELAREYTTEKLNRNPELWESAHSRHSTYYNYAVRGWGDDLKSIRQLSALKEMDLEIDNARAAWSWAVEKHRVDLLDISTDGFRYYFLIRGLIQEAEIAFHQAAERLKSGTSGDELRVYARLISVRAYFTYGDERKRYLYQHSLKVIDQLDSLGQDVRYEKAWVLNFMGELVSRSDFNEAIRFTKQSLSLFDELGERYWASTALSCLGTIYYLWGKLNDAYICQQQSLANFRELGDPKKIANNLLQIYLIYSRKGEFEKAERAAREGLEFLEMIGDSAAIASGHAGLGSCLRYQGKFELAETLLEKAMEVHWEQEHFLAFLFLDASYLCFVKLDLGKYLQAQYLAQSALDWTGGSFFVNSEFLERDTETRRIGITYTIQGMASLALGRISEAEDLLRRSAEILKDIQTISMTAFHHSLLGIVSLNLKRPDKAKGHIRDGINIGIQISSAIVFLRTLSAAALYLAVQGDLERAVEIYALARRYPWIAKSQWQKDVVEGPLTNMTASLPADVIAAAQQRGRERDLEETVKELLNELV